MAEHIFVTGGTGFVGEHLVPALLALGHRVTVLTRNPRSSPRPELDYVTELGDGRHWSYTQVINLQGENLFSRRWSERQKQIMRDSRIAFTRALVEEMAKAPRVRKLISASAIGYYGMTGDEPLSEDSAPGQDFSAKLCCDWEAEATRASNSQITVHLVRLGVVLGNGGALAKLLPQFKLGGGGRIASGRQWFSWVHIDDVVKIFLACVQGNIDEPVINATAPHPVNNSDFTNTLGRVVKRPTLFVTPGWLLRLLLGEAATLLIGGQRVVPQVLLEKGFEFRYPTLEAALRAEA